MASKKGKQLPKVVVTLELRAGIFNFHTAFNKTEKQMTEVKINTCTFCSSEHIIENLIMEATSNKNDIIRIGFWENTNPPSILKIKASICGDCGSIVRLFVSKPEHIA